MRKFRYIFCIILSLIQIYIPASSFADMNVNLDSDTGFVSVSGSYDEMVDKRVTVQILAPGMSADDVLSLGEKSFDDIFANVFEVVADSRGSFELPSFRLKSSGTYNARVTYHGAVTEPLYVEKLCRYFSAQDMAMVSQYLESGNEDELFEYVDGHVDLFFTDMDLYKSCSEDVRRDIVAVAMDMDDNKSSEAFAINLARVCGIYFAGTDKSHAFDNFKRFYEDSCYETDYTPLAYYSEYISENDMEDIIEKICTDGSWKKCEDTLEAVSDEIVLLAIRKSANHSFVERILTDNEDYLRIDLEDYKKLKDKRSVNKGIIEYNAKTVDSLVSEFYDLVDDASKSKEKPSGGSSGGSVAPATGNNVSVNLPDNTLVQIQDPQTGNAGLVFGDMEGYAWAEEAVYALCNKGIVSGVSSNRFVPGSYVTREEFAKMFIGAIFGSVADGTTIFEDVEKGSWYEKYVAAGYDNNIINGISPVTFGVGMNITRQDIAAIIYRADADLFDGQIVADNITDIEQIADYARESVDALLSAGIINGYTDASFRPASFATRAEAAVIIYRYLKFAERG